jgi:CRP/FNR family cyclic AMP-dependent transcriptional regulator
MLRFLHAEPDFAEVFTAYLLTRNSSFQADLVDHLFNSSEKRLARALLLLANFGKEGRPEPITTKISQGILTEMTGTTGPASASHGQIQGAWLCGIQWWAEGPQFVI